MSFCVKLVMGFPFRDVDESNLFQSSSRCRYAFKKSIFIKLNFPKIYTDNQSHMIEISEGATMNKIQMTFCSLFIIKKLIKRRFCKYINIIYIILQLLGS